jgi:hypothetical protein
MISDLKSLKDGVYIHRFVFNHSALSLVSRSFSLFDADYIHPTVDCKECVRCPGDDL